MKSRRCLQTMQAAHPVASSSLTNLLEEAKSIQLNLAPEVRSLCTNHPYTFDPLCDSNTQKEARERLLLKSICFFFNVASIEFGCLRHVAKTLSSGRDAVELECCFSHPEEAGWETCQSFPRI